jgi:hypothetical protein
MSGTDESAKTGGGLVYIKFSDLAGAGRAGERLVDALAAGLGPTVRHWLNTLFARVEQRSAARWFDEAKKAGLMPTALEYQSVEGRTNLRLTAENLKAQDNREAIGAYALRELQALQIAGQVKNDPPPVEPEWLNRFWRLAQDVTSDDLRSLWGHLLARQATGAGKVSARTLEALSMLDRWEIDELTRIAALMIRAIGKGVDEHGILIAIGPHGDHQLDAQRVNERLMRIVRMETYGHFGSIGFFSAQSWNVNVTDLAACELRLAGVRYGLWIPAHQGGQALGWTLNRTGREVIDLIRTAPSEEYISALSEGFSLVNGRFEIRPPSPAK